jgi:glycosyltransferase involved in cell wall biosynthesis
LILDALVELKKDYPDLRVCIGGKNPLNYSLSIIDKIKSRFDYGYYLKRMIKKRNLEENIYFLGNLKEEEVVMYMLSSHVTLLPSTIENSPNSLCEAQCLGVPCVASYVGGTPDLTDNGKLSLLYRCEEWEILVQYVKKIFESDEFAMQLSNKSRAVALKRHDHSENAKTMLNIYKEIISK